MDTIKFKNVVRPIGNSLGVIIPKTAFKWEDLNFEEGDIIEVTIKKTGKKGNMGPEFSLTVLSDDLTPIIHTPNLSIYKRGK